jgi:outer membrane lipoprotein LolB
VRVDAHEGQPARNLSAAFELRGDAEHGELDLVSPLGNTLARARWAPGRAQLLTSDGATAYPDLEALARETLGEALPLGALFDWLRGRPWPGAPSGATATGFEQLGWSVDLQRRAEGWIVARRDAPPAVTVRARMDTP